MATKKKLIAEPVIESPKLADEKPGPENRMPETQLQLFDRAMRHFRAQQFREARDLFDKAAQGGLREIAHNARAHISMCNRRLDRPEIQLKSLEEFYTHGVERLNARDFDGAR